MSGVSNSAKRNKSGRLCTFLTHKITGLILYGMKVDKGGTEKVNHFNTSITAKGSIPIYQIQDESNVGEKHKLEDLADVVSKKQKQKQSNEDILYSTPKGLIWDGVDYSCAYDALFSILHNIWLSDTTTWSETFTNTSQILRY